MKLGVRVSLNSFDFAHPSEKQVQVFARIPNVVEVAYLLPEQMWEDLRDAEWIDALNEAHDYDEKNMWIDTAREKKAALRAWLAVDENQDALNVAWFEDRARRDPVSRSLMADKKRLTARVAELEERIERRRMRMVRADADLQEMRGLLSPNGFPRRVPPEVEIHERVAPAVEWLLARVAELEAERHETNKWLEDAAKALRTKQGTALTEAANELERQFIVTGDRLIHRTKLIALLREWAAARTGGAS